MGKSKTTKKAPPITIPPAKPKRNGRRQQMFPGTEPPRIGELDEAAEPYVLALYERQRLQREEEQFRAALVERMRELKQERYTYQDGEARYLITLQSKSKIVCKREKDIAVDLEDDA